MASWEVILDFTMNGPAPVNTGEGLAFWHVSDPDNKGSVYGHTDKFNGVGVFFDSFDSDGDVSQFDKHFEILDRNCAFWNSDTIRFMPQGVGESYVLAMYNDGTKTIDEDGAGIQLGVCFADYRNLAHVARARIAFSPGLSNPPSHCFVMALCPES